MVEISLSEQNIADIVSRHLWEGMNDQERNELVQKGIAEVLTRQSYNRQSLLQKAFTDALNEVAREEVTKYVRESAEVVTRIRMLIGRAVEVALVQEADKVVAKLVDVIIEVLGNKMGREQR